MLFPSSLYEQQRDAVEGELVEAIRRGGGGGGAGSISLARGAMIRSSRELGALLCC